MCRNITILIKTVQQQLTAMDFNYHLEKNSQKELSTNCVTYKLSPQVVLIEVMKQN